MSNKSTFNNYESSRVELASNNKVILSQDALQDVVPMDWSSDVIDKTGEKVQIKKK
ncbi:hypothetical protein [Anaeromicropila herbilytica]|uniref:Uncharacterized protein n=1 Tax=Anaeromicropila herbilytica TaxID=2785025 RepID=A0A7R7EJI3_9FIRM|nr:hypothetical protein [Anaeromicropila herbilytica]BCN29864.1 hypothetical protein bsdtb5_11590 [Anaeromicropila herbilytica]